MKKIIHHVRRIREKPEHVRRHILHIATGICAILLGLLWIYSLGRNLVPRPEEKKVKGPEPLSVFKDNFVNGYNSIRDSN